MSFWLILGALLGSTPAPLVATAPRTITALPAGHSLKIGYRSRGCFHTVEYELLLQRRRQAVTITIVELQHRVVKKKWTILRRDLGQHPLRSTQVTRLDQLLTYYRTPGRKGGCTTSERIRLSWHRPGTPPVKEQHIDNSCGAPAKLIRIEALVRTLRPKAP